MKIIKSIIVTLFIASVVLSCQRNKPYMISGRLLYSCDSVAANEDALYIKQDIVYAFNFNKQKLSKDFSTNENGFFHIGYKRKEAVNSFFNIYYDNKLVLDSIPYKENINLGDVYIGKRPISYLIRLEVDNSYTENDTLIIRDYNQFLVDKQAVLRIPGPFQNEIVDTVWNFPYGYSATYGKTSKFENVEYKISSSGELGWKSTGFDIPNFCSGQIYEAVIKVE